MNDENRWSWEEYGAQNMCMEINTTKVGLGNGAYVYLSTSAVPNVLLEKEHARHTVHDCGGYIIV